MPTKSAKARTWTDSGAGSRSQRMLGLLKKQFSKFPTNMKSLLRALLAVAACVCELDFGDEAALTRALKNLCPEAPPEIVRCKTAT
jgi:hypothetical protein